MGLTITGFNLAIKQDDAFSIRATSTGTLTLEVGSTVELEVKRNRTDETAVITKSVVISTEDQVDFDFTTAETEDLIGEYVYSMKLTQSGNEYTIVPDGGGEEYPTFSVGGVLIE